MSKQTSRSFVLALTLVVFCASFSTVAAQSTSTPVTQGVTGTDPEPINPVTGTDPEPIKPFTGIEAQGVTGTDPEPIQPVTDGSEPDTIWLAMLVLLGVA